MAQQATSPCVATPLYTPIHNHHTLSHEQLVARNRFTPLFVDECTHNMPPPAPATPIPESPILSPISVASSASVRPTSDAGLHLSSVPCHDAPVLEPLTPPPPAPPTPVRRRGTIPRALAHITSVPDVFLYTPPGVVAGIDAHVVTPPSVHASAPGCIPVPPHARTPFARYPSPGQSTPVNSSSIHSPVPASHLPAGTPLAADCVKVCCWNVAGLRKKLCDPVFMSIVCQSECDLFFFTETRCKLPAPIIRGYNVSNFHHAYQSDRGTQSSVRSGGVAVAIRHHFVHKVRAVRCVGPSMVHVHVDGLAVSLEHDVHFLCVYVPHARSRFYTPAVWCSIVRFAATLPPSDHFVLLGDMNARTASTTPEWVSAPRSLMEPTDVEARMRVSLDARMTAHGREFLNVCGASRLHILNGLREVGLTTYQFDESYTCHRTNGASVIDYVCCTGSLLPQVASFKCGDPKGLSDHVPVYCTLRGLPHQPPAVHIPPHHDTLFEPAPTAPRKLRWQTAMTHAMDQALQSPLFLPVSTMAKQLLDTCAPVGHEALTELYALFINSLRACSRVAATAQPTTQPEARTSGIQADGPTSFRCKHLWYDNECMAAKRVYDRQLELLKRAHRGNRRGTCARASRQLHESTQAARNHYHNICRRKQRQWECKVLSEVDCVLRANRRDVWAQVDALLGERPQAAASNAPPLSSLSLHFASVFSQPLPDRLHAHDTAPHTDEPADLHAVEYVSMDDLEVLLGRVDGRKATGWDGIPPALLHDMRSSESFKETLHAVLNVFVRNAFWPPEWNRILIAPIPKPDKPPNAPDSYRPIHLIVVLAKLMSAVTDRQIRRMVEIVREQLGFRPDHGTRDNHFVLQALIQKYKSQGLYTCFVDFRMAFDSVDRTLLLHKLHTLHNIPLAWLRLICAMYTHVRASIKGTDAFFHETIGVKQGDPLSPLLFLLYLHDLPDALCPPDRPHDYTTHLDQHALRCLLWADDLLLSATCARGLQAQLDLLAQYCQKWKLTVNVKKTQVVVFASRRNRIATDTFTYMGAALERVSEFRYLGVVLNESCRFAGTFGGILESGKRAMYACMARVTRLGPCSAALKVMLFNAYVRPVLLYCLEVMPLSPSQARKLDDIQVRYVRWCFDLPSDSPRADTLAEAGLRPLSYEVSQARIHYRLLVTNRPSVHITASAMRQLFQLHGNPPSVASRTWVAYTHRDAVAWQCADIDWEGKSSTKRRISNCGWQKWLACLTGIQSPPVWAEQQDWQSLDLQMSVRALHVHARDGRGNRMYLHACGDSLGWGGEYRKVYLPPSLLRSFCMVRLGIARLHVYTGRRDDTPLLRRTCHFCKSVYHERFVEDAYHLCMECPLTDALRTRVFTCLSRSNFVFPQNCGLWEVFVQMLAVSCRGHVHTVARFLDDCLRVRDLYLDVLLANQPPAREPPRIRRLRAIAVSHPTPTTTQLDNQPSLRLLCSLVPRGKIQAALSSPVFNQLHY